MVKTPNMNLVSSFQLVVMLRRRQLLVPSITIVEVHYAVASQTILIFPFGMLETMQYGLALRLVLCWWEYCFAMVNHCAVKNA
jgi:hypothetical protein